MAVDKKLKEKIIKEVKEGKSYYSVAKKYNLTPSSVRDICLRAGVKSKFKHAEKKYTDEEIIDFVKSKGVISQRELEKELGYTALNHRLLRMARDGKIRFIRLLGRSKYLGCKRLVYVDDEDLKNWFLEQLPNKMPKGLRALLRSKLKDLGVDVDLSYKYASRAVGIDPELYDKLKEEARKKNVSLKKYVEDILKGR